jgi:uncharacterized protein with PIN domain
MLGKLARYLRLLGYDVIYTTKDDEEILNILYTSQRILITKDKLLCQKASERCIYIRSNSIVSQLRELMLECGIPLCLPKKPKRCTLCNTPLKELGYVERHGTVWVCPMCGQPYWIGSHLRNVFKILFKARSLLSLFTHSCKHEEGVLFNVEEG